MRFNELLEQYIGNCINLFDPKTGGCDLPDFIDVSDFANKDENAKEIGVDEFRQFVQHIPDELEDLIKQYDHQFLYYDDNNLFVLYIEPVWDDNHNAKENTDVHYFFRKKLAEAPISDIQPMGDPDPEIDQDYADEDEGVYKAWTEPEKRDWLSDTSKGKKWRSGIVKSWSKTKNNYLIIPVFGEDAYNYENLEKGIVPVIELATEFPEGYNFLQEIEVLDLPTNPEKYGTKLAHRSSKHADKTIVFFLGNAADQWVRASGWMLLHRLGHASRTTHLSQIGVNPAYSHALTLMFEQLQDTFSNFGIDFWLKHNDNVDAKVPLRKAQENWNVRDWAVYALQKIMTMRSARAGKLRDEYEALYEMWAQYLNTGGVKFRVPETFDFGGQSRNNKPEIKNEQELTPGDIQLIDGYLQEFEQVMNEEAFPPMEESIAGEILIM